MKGRSRSSIPSAASEDSRLVNLGPFPPELFIRLAELVLPTRAHTYFDNVGLEFVGDLVRHSRPELFAQPNLGRRTVRQIEAALQELGLALGMSVRNWELVNHELAAAKYSIDVHEVRRGRSTSRPRLVLPSAPPAPETVSHEPTPTSVEEEVELLLFRALKPRDLTVLSARIAWREEQSPTLQVIGDAFQVSRERIRQIVFDAKRRAARLRLDAPLTRRCVERVTELAPAELSEVEATLLGEGFLLGGTRLRAVMTAAGALGVDCNFTLEKTPLSTRVLSKEIKRFPSEPTNEAHAWTDSQVRPGVVSAARPATRKNPVRRETGYTRGGDVWVEYQVSKASISNGVFSFPPNLEQMASRYFRVEDEAGVRLTTLRVNNGLVWGFSPYFLRRGLEPGAK